jgi:hypothetical protein
MNGQSSKEVPLPVDGIADTVFGDDMRMAFRRPVTIRRPVTSYI